MAQVTREMRGVRRRFARGPAWVVLASVWLLMACDVGGDPQRRAQYDADKARCQQMADSMVARARASGGEVDADEFEPARMSCMSYRGWKDGKFR